MTELLEQSLIDRAALANALAQSKAMLAKMDRFEALIEPLAQFAAAKDKELVLQLQRILEIFPQWQKELGTGAPGLSGSLSDAGSTHILALCEPVQSNLAQLHAGIRSLLAATANPEVRQLGQQVLDLMAQLFAVAEQIRVFALEAQADADIAGGRVKKFGNAAAALAYLQRLPQPKPTAEK